MGIYGGCEVRKKCGIWGVCRKEEIGSTWGVRGKEEIRRDTMKRQRKNPLDSIANVRMVSGGILVGTYFVVDDPKDATSLRQYGFRVLTTKTARERYRLPV
jgi:hypothetical protein